MNCDECREHLPELVIGELAEPTRARVVAHVTSCADCALEHARWSLDLGAIAAAWEVEPPAAVGDALRRRIEQAFVPWWKRAFAIAARPVPAYGVLAAVLLPIALWSFSAPRSVPAPSPAAMAPTIPSVSTSEIPAARIVGYDARDIVPAPVF